MAKVPRPGRVKTRMELPGEVASQLYSEFLQAVLTLVDGVDLVMDRWLAIALGPEDAQADAEALLPRGWRLLIQRGAELGERMQAAAADAGAERVVILGSDAPTMPGDRIVEAFRALDSAPAVFGPTDDGGYYLVGLRGAQPALFAGIPWSTAEVMAETRKAAARAGLAIAELSPWYDVDRREDLERAVADGFPCRAWPFALVPSPHGKDRT